MRLIDYFDRSADLYPNRPFLVGASESRTYQDARAFSRRIAFALARDGVAPGAIAAVFSANAIRPFECVLGLLRAGCVWAPLNARNTIADSIYALKNTRTEILFHSADLSDAVGQIAPRCPNLKRLICIEANCGATLSLDQFVADAPAIFENIAYKYDDVATLFSSGGTTGEPKGVMMRHRAWSAMVQATLQLQACEDPVHLVAAPMTHAAGGSALIMSAMGATNVVLPSFDAEAVMQAIERHKVTHLFLPPTAIYRMLSHPKAREHDYSSLKYFNYASAPMAPERIKQAIDVFGPVMMTAFGQTETGVLNTFFSPEDHMDVLKSGDERRLQSCGRPTHFVSIQIIDDDGAVLPAEALGEIAVQGDQVMSGYFNNPEETARTMINGWRRTGDIGFMDADGWLFLVDRKRDIIISGGFNVFPAEVEKAIISHPAVQDCAVIGAPDADWGEAVIAVIELKPSESLPAEDIAVWARKRLSGVQTPKQFHIWAELPRSPAGKVLRRAVRDAFRQAQKRHP